MNWYYLKVVPGILKENVPDGLKCNNILIYEDVIPGNRGALHLMEIKYGNIVWVKHEWTVLPK